MSLSELPKKHFSTLKLKTTQKIYVKPGKFYPTLFVNLKITKKNCASLIVNGANINDPSLMAESFNKFFASAAINVVNKINPSNKSATENITYNNNIFSLSNSPVTISEILDATKLLQDKKTPDHNGISSNFL